jgi:acyl-CoA thioester hydrolase
VKVRVYYEDTDAGGIVYHSNYLNFCERARSEYFFQAGSTPILDGGEFVVASLTAKFKASARLGDMLDVKTQILALKSSSLLLHQSVYKDNMVLFEMEIKLAYVKTGEIGRMKPEMQAYIKRLFLEIH